MRSLNTTRTTYFYGREAERGKEIACVFHVSCWCAKYLAMYTSACTGTVFSIMSRKLIQASVLQGVDETKELMSDWVVLNYHGGAEFTYLPIPHKRDLLHEYLKYGIDIIIGNHSHVVQGYEKIKNKLIISI